MKESIFLNHMFNSDF